MEAMIDVLPVTAGRMMRVWWAYFWRSLMTLLAGFIVIFLTGLLFGLLFGLAMPALGLDKQALQGISQTLGTVLGFILGLLSSVIPMWLILGRDFGEFRLALITYEPVTASGDGETPV